MQEQKASSQGNESVYPLQFNPVFKDYPWGGRNLTSALGRSIPDGVVAESWDIAAHSNGSSTVRNGELAGMSLPDVMDKLGVDLVGTRNQQALDSGKFPLLIKLLDANSWLSVQVHPGDEYALEYESDFGKTEMWVVLRAAPGAELIYGFKPGVSKDLFAQAIDDGSVADWLYHLPVEVGDVIFVPAGTVHALGPGVIVAEIQQNSDTTYRIYDWGRPRPIHVRQALDVLDFSIIEPTAYRPQPITENGIRRELIGECAYFRTERIYMPAGSDYGGDCNGETFEIWGVLEGSAEVGSQGGDVELNAVDWTVLPAALGDYAIHAETDSVLLRVTTPDKVG